jgi:hypothetical protein
MAGHMLVLSDSDSDSDGVLPLAQRLKRRAGSSLCLVDDDDSSGSDDDHLLSDTPFALTNDAVLAAALQAEEEAEERERKKRRLDEAHADELPSADPPMLAAQLCRQLRSCDVRMAGAGGAGAGASAAQQHQQATAALKAASVKHGLPLHGLNAAMAALNAYTAGMANALSATVPCNGLVVNYDHALRFLERYARELAASPRHAARILVVYHGTGHQNFSKIVDGNLKVPGGGSGVRHATDNGFYGKGVYTTPDVNLALSYARGGCVFVCLALPGRQFSASLRDRGKACRAGYDSHYGGHGKELVFFSSDQLLPVFLVDAAQAGSASAGANTAIDTIAAATGNKEVRGKSCVKATPRGAPEHLSKECLFREAQQEWLASGKQAARQEAAAKKSCVCGSSTHQRRSARACPLNPRNLNL